MPGGFLILKYVVVISFFLSLGAITSYVVVISFFLSLGRGGEWSYKKAHYFIVCFVCCGVIACAI
jgi:hypothetical protein